jgi:hypothetical protein
LRVMAWGQIFILDKEKEIWVVPSKLVGNGVKSLSLTRERDKGRTFKTWVVKIVEFVRSVHCVY